MTADLTPGVPVSVVVPSPVPAREHVGIVPVVPGLRPVRVSLLNRVRGWFS